MSLNETSDFIQQLPLGLTLPDDALLDNYTAGSNHEALAQVKQLAKGEGEFYIYLWGGRGEGCSHLLQGACHLANDFDRSAMYLPLEEVHALSPSLLKGLERLDLVCLDDIHAIAGIKEWEEAIFHLYNRLRDGGQSRLLIAGNQPPKGLKVQLADLQSRLTWGVTYHLQHLSDEDKLKALQLRAKQRGLELPDEVGHFILRRAARNMGQLYGLLSELDKASLVAKRKLTIPFVKSVLNW